MKRNINKDIPEVSIIIPAYKAKKTIYRALKSIKIQDYDLNQIEVIISVDDGESYSEALQIIPNIKILYSKSKQKSGPGQTRNRAISISQGRVIAFLDSDDTWGKDYLKPLNYLAKRYGLSFGVTEVVSENGSTLIKFPEKNYLDIKDFGKFPGSFHPVIMSKLASPFPDGPSQDVIHALRLLGFKNGRAPLSKQSTYKIWLRKKSITSLRGFSSKVNLSYNNWLKYFRNQKQILSSKIINETIFALEKRRNWNKLYTFNGQGRLFYEFVSENFKN